MAAEHGLDLTMDEFHALHGIDDAGTLGLKNSTQAHTFRNLVELGYASMDDKDCLFLTPTGTRVLREVQLLNRLAHTEEVGKDGPGEAHVSIPLIDNGLVRDIAGLLVLTRAGLALHVAMHCCKAQPHFIAD